MNTMQMYVFNFKKGKHFNFECAILKIETMENVNTSELWEHLNRDFQQLYRKGNLTEIQFLEKIKNYQEKFNGKILQVEAYIEDIKTNYVTIIIPRIAAKRDKKKIYLDATLCFKYDKTLKDKLLLFSKSEFVMVQGRITKIDTALVNLELISIEKATPLKSISKSKCYLTSACTDAMQLPDNCYELQILRKFRDEYVVAKTNGKFLLDEYYHTAPKIVSAINATAKKNTIYKNLFFEIRRAVSLIEDNRFEDAYQLYCNMAIRLRKKYL